MFNIDAFIAETSKSTSLSKMSVSPKEIHRWKIEGYSLLDKIQNPIISKPFFVNNLPFVFLLNKNVPWGEKKIDCITFGIRLHENTKEMNLRYRLSYIHQSSDRQKDIHSEIFSSNFKVNTNCTIAQNIQSEIETPANGYIVNDTLVVQVEVEPINAVQNMAFSLNNTNNETMCSTTSDVYPRPRPNPHPPQRLRFSVEPTYSGCCSIQ